MFKTQNTPPDPRERLVTVGNQLLDVVFELELLGPQVKELMALKDDQDAFSTAVKEGGMDVILKELELHGKRSTALREYVTLRATIEALTGSRS